MTASPHNRRQTDRPVTTDKRVAEFTACMGRYARTTNLTASEAVAACAAYLQQPSGQIVRVSA